MYGVHTSCVAYRVDMRADTVLTAPRRLTSSPGRFVPPEESAYASPEPIAVLAARGREGRIHVSVTWLHGSIPWGEKHCVASDVEKSPRAADGCRVHQRRSSGQWTPLGVRAASRRPLRDGSVRVPGRDDIVGLGHFKLSHSQSRRCSSGGGYPNAL